MAKTKATALVKGRNALGFISVGISLATLIYIGGYRLGQIDTKVNLLWKVYVEQALIGSHENPLDRVNTFFATENNKEAVSKILKGDEALEIKVLMIINKWGLEELKNSVPEQNTLKLIGTLALFVESQSPPLKLPY